MTDDPSPSDPGAPVWARRLAALLEVLAVFVGSIILQRLTQGLLGIELWHDVQDRMVEEGGTDFLLLAGLAAVELFVRYAYLFGLACLIGRWHRKRPIHAYGLHSGGRSTRRLVILGLWIYGAGILPILLQFSGRWLPIGEGPAHWGLFPDTFTWDFMLYMAVGSFLVVPVVEELAARGYMQTRLAEDFGPAGAIFITAFFFAIGHSQYFKLEILSFGMLVSIVISSVVMGYAFFRTGSLWPCIIAHGLINLPIPNSVAAEALQLVVMAGLLVWCHREAIAEWPRFRAAMSSVDSWAAVAAAMAALVLLLAALMLRGDLMVPAVLVILVVALAIEYADRRRRVD